MIARDKKLPYDEKLKRIQNIHQDDLLDIDRLMDRHNGPVDVF